MWLARHVGATIIVADSRQVYRGLDIGTAKPTPAEQEEVPHRGIDVVPPTERYSAAAWAANAEAWIAEADGMKRPPVVVGGTGFYLRALFEPLFEEPPLDPARRRALTSMLGTLSTGELKRWTRALDPMRAHLGRSQLLRSIEIALLSGQRLSDLHRRAARPRRRRARYLVVDPGDALADRIMGRIDTMLAGGWVEEVTRLMRTVPDDAPAWKATGYRIVRGVARGQVDLASARASILVETRQYAKRQRTWFRHQLPASSVTRIDPRSADVHDVVARWWHDVTPIPTPRSLP